MRVPSNILTGFKGAGAQIGPEDADLLIQPQLVPIAEIPRPLATIVDIGLSGPFVANDSCIVNGSYTIINAARATPNVVTLQPGVWVLTVDWNAGWSFITATLGAITAQYQSTGGFLTCTLISIPSIIVANGFAGGQIGPLRLSLSFPLLLSMDVPASGVGQTSFMQASFNCSRMG